MSEIILDVAVVGLGVMGQSIILNLADNGYSVCIYNRTAKKTEAFLNGEAKGKNIRDSDSLADLVAKIKRPRIIFLFVKAGKPTGDYITNLALLLDTGDVIIDGGNSQFMETTRRCQSLLRKGIFLVGCGVSGGAEGIRNRPSLMLGGPEHAWPIIKEMIEKISAKDNDQPCCVWVGGGGSGHLVKIIHNGIEYGDMQLICEAYHLLKQLLNLPNERIAEIFKEWSQGEHDSYLMEIASNILNFHEGDYVSLLDKINDKAGQKGTGKWTTVSSLEYGIPSTLIGEAVFARCLSTLKEEREEASLHLKGPDQASFDGDVGSFIDDVRKALYVSKIISYAQGFMLMKETGQNFGWNLNLSSLAKIWSGGCIIRSSLLTKMKESFEEEPNLPTILLSDYFSEIINRCQESWRRVISTSVTTGIPIPAFSSVLAFYDGYRSSWLPANLIQAQRDYFGAHTYERKDQPLENVHTEWEN